MRLGGNKQLECPSCASARPRSHRGHPVQRQNEFDSAWRGLVHRRRVHPVRRAAGDKPPPYPSKPLWSSTTARPIWFGYVGRGLVPRRRVHPVRRAAGDKPPPYPSKPLWSSGSWGRCAVPLLPCSPFYAQSSTIPLHESLPRPIVPVLRCVHEGRSLESRGAACKLLSRRRPDLFSRSLGFFGRRCTGVPGGPDGRGR
jgi:hypothetical protein